MNNRFNLAKLQNIEYQALEYLGEVCRENKITFFMRGGSALGTVKYGGFVPWDDDIDIALPRRDYLKLIKVMPRHFGNYYEFVCYQNVKGAHCYFPRVLLSKEYCKKNEIPCNNERGLVLIDILPLDGMPDNKVLREIHIFKAYFYRALSSLWTMDVAETIRTGNQKQQKILKFLHTIGIHKLYKQDSIYRHLDKMYAKYKFGKTKYSGMLASSKLEKEIMKSDWWGDGTKMLFRDLSVKVPKNYDAYLKQLFGENYANYEPPKEKRTLKHFRGNL